MYIYMYVFQVRKRQVTYQEIAKKKIEIKKKKIKQNNKTSNSSKSQNTIQLKITPQIKFLLVGIFMKIILPNIQICLF